MKLIVENLYGEYEPPDNVSQRIVLIKRYLKKEVKNNQE